MQDRPTAGARRTSPPTSTARSRLTPWYFGGSTVRTPRVRAWAMRRWRHSHGTTESSSDSTQPLPSHRANGHDCGDAAVRCVLRFHGLPAGRVKLATPGDGADPSQIQAALAHAGLRVLAGTMTVPDLAHLCRTGRPVVCLIRRDGQGHYVVCSGVSRGRVHYHDPLSGVRAARTADWAAGWHDLGRWGQAFRSFGIAAWPQG